MICNRILSPLLLVTILVFHQIDFLLSCFVRPKLLQAWVTRPVVLYEPRTTPSSHDLYDYYVDIQDRGDHLRRQQRDLEPSPNAEKDYESDPLDRAARRIVPANESMVEVNGTKRPVATKVLNKPYFDAKKAFELSKLPKPKPPANATSSGNGTAGAPANSTS